MTPLLQAQNLSKSYGQIQIFKELSLEISQGESVAISGASGCGKTSLLSILAGIDQDYMGKIKLEETFYNTLSPHLFSQFRAKNTGIIFQEFHLLESLTVEENIQLPCKLLKIKMDHTWVDHLIKSVNLQDRRKHYPWQLSGGEQQRTAIARSMIHRPKIIFADEPTGNLDEKNATIVEDILFDLVKTEKTSLFVISHNLNLCDRAHRHFKLTHGQLHL